MLPGDNPQMTSRKPCASHRGLTAFCIPSLVAISPSWGEAITSSHPKVNAQRCRQAHSPHLHALRTPPRPRWCWNMITWRLSIKTHTELLPHRPVALCTFSFSNYCSLRKKDFTYVSLSFGLPAHRCLARVFPGRDGQRGHISCCPVRAPAVAW